MKILAFVVIDSSLWEGKQINDTKLFTSLGDAEKFYDRVEGFNLTKSLHSYHADGTYTLIKIEKSESYESITHVTDSDFDEMYMNSVDDRTTEYFIERESTERDVVEHFSKGRETGNRYS
jgi:hypothetical protein